jgi:hypothetical protein
MDDANKYIMRQQIAAMLDYPSVYMGGPSPQSLRKAMKIVEHLTREYEIKPGIEAENDAANVRTWRKSPWDSLERI